MAVDASNLKQVPAENTPVKQENTVTNEHSPIRKSPVHNQSGQQSTQPTANSQNAVQAFSSINESNSNISISAAGQPKKVSRGRRKSQSECKSLNESHTQDDEQRPDSSRQVQTRTRTTKLSRNLLLSLQQIDGRLGLTDGLDIDDQSSILTQSSFALNLTSRLRMTSDMSAQNGKFGNDTVVFKYPTHKYDVANLRQKRKLYPCSRKCCQSFDDEFLKSVLAQPVKSASRHLSQLKQNFEASHPPLTLEQLESALNDQQDLVLTDQPSPGVNSQRQPKIPSGSKRAQEKAPSAAPGAKASVLQKQPSETKPSTKNGIQEDVDAIQLDQLLSPTRGGTSRHRHKRQSDSSKQQQLQQINAAQSERISRGPCSSAAADAGPVQISSKNDKPVLKQTSDDPKSQNLPASLMELPPPNDLDFCLV